MTDVELPEHRAPLEVDDLDDAPERREALLTCAGCDIHENAIALAHCGGTTGCHKTFRRESGFNVHRFEGRCRTTAELTELGYWTDENNRWFKPLPDDPLKRPAHWRT